MKDTSGLTFYSLITFFPETIILLLDINECELGIDNCNEQATCNNTEGSYSCICNTGWTGNGISCEGTFV